MPFFRLVRGVVLCWVLPITVAGQASSMRGFLVRNLVAERKLEQQAQAVPDTGRLRKYMNYIAGQPHNAGSPGSKATADYLLELLKGWGLDAQIEQFEALMPFPLVQQLEVVAPERFTAKLKEPPVLQDPDSADSRQLPTFNAYSASGDITGEVVYANFGMPDDYDWLAKQGVSVKGKIVVTRYGKSWRGIKPKLAYEHGAIGCVIYSDPREDGYFEGDVFPKGPMRPEDGVQRGSVLDMLLYPGDPLSPGWASETGSRRLALSEAKTIVKIPVLPISYGDAQPILAQLTGPVAPLDWRGALPITYHVGPGATVVHIRTDYDWTSKPLYDVIATIPGLEAPDEWVLAGNHHDAWVNGADDPVSGAVALLETARTLGSLRSQGWKPRRTIKLAFWDGEEFGLLGSTEWIEKHRDELRQKAAVYMNSDNTGRGWLNVGGSQTLEKFVAETADAVLQPGTNVSLADYAVRHFGEGEDQRRPPQSDHGFAIQPLGAGSDFQGFLDHLGIASLNEEFSGQTRSGIYHSIYDSIYWYTHFSDTTQVDGRALSQYTTTSLLRLANGSVLPFEFGHFAGRVGQYVDQIQREAENNGRRMEFNTLRKQIDALRERSDNFDALLEVVLQKAALDDARLQGLNQLLLRSERVLTRPDGLPNRPWYKHQIYAPGFYTGYSVKTLPGIREAVEMKNWRLAQQQTSVVELCLMDLNQVLSEATDRLAGF